VRASGKINERKPPPRSCCSQQAADLPRGINIKNDQHNAVDSRAVSGGRGGSVEK